MSNELSCERSGFFLSRYDKLLFKFTAYNENEHKSTATSYIIKLGSNSKTQLVLIHA